MTIWNDVILDIETMPHLSAKMRETLMEGIKAPSNYKDPEKIDAYVEKEKEKREAGAALHPYSGRISAIGIWAVDMVNVLGEGFTVGEGPQVNIVKTPVEEKSAIKSLINVLGRLSLPRIVTFSGREFDLPYLVARSAILGFHDLDPGRWRFPSYRYDPSHVDLRDYLTKGALNLWAEAMLGKTKLLSGGADAAQAAVDGHWDLLSSYLKKDLEITGKIWLRIRDLLRWRVES